MKSLEAGRRRVCAVCCVLVGRGLLKQLLEACSKRVAVKWVRCLDKVVTGDCNGLPRKALGGKFW